MKQATKKITGKVIIAAAGPGDAELLTVKAARYLEQADVILSDRLVNPEIIRCYARKGAEVVDVGKQSGKSGSATQVSINHLMASYALQGKLVVRLKGGDVSVFSNVLDELEILSSMGIPYELVPGVTSALGAAAYAGIPLTARGYAKGVRLLTFHTPDVIPEGDWRDWASTLDTLVFYMSGQVLPELATRLHESGMPADKPLAIISQATTPYQQVRLGSIGEFLTPDHTPAFVSPTLIIVGDVVKLHPRFQWFQTEQGAGTFFPSLPGESTKQTRHQHAGNP